jgi:hypothetical protein
MEFSEFKDYYEKHGKCPNDIQKRSQPLNDTQLRSRYKKYLKSQEKAKEARKRHIKKNVSRKIGRDEQWVETREEAFNIYGRECLLIRALKDIKAHEYVKWIKKSSAGLHKIIDPAHVFSRGAYPQLKYDPENVVPLNRYSHSCLDQMRNPINGAQITKEEQIGWWKFIIGDETYERLEGKL